MAFIEELQRSPEAKKLKAEMKKVAEKYGADQLERYGSDAIRIRRERSISFREAFTIARAK